MEEKNYKYMVAVQCMTFNQSKYILDALNGFVMQQTNFPYVVMVVDDASTDGEQKVIRQFVTEQFDTADTSIAYEKETDYAHITYAKHKTNENCYIAVLYLKENLYSQGRSEDKFKYLSEWRDHVKYEAVCEGDDYWIHPEKLQMQVDFLEEHEEYVMCSHRYIKHYEEENYDLKDGLDRYFSNSHDGVEFCLDYGTDIPLTLSIVYKMLYIKEFENSPCPKYDHILYYFILKHGKGYCFNIIMGVYRLNNGGICGKQPMLKRVTDAYLSCKALYIYEQNYYTRKKYYSRYAALFVLTKGKILLHEKFELKKFLSLFWYLLIKLKNIHLWIR